MKEQEQLNYNWIAEAIDHRKVISRNLTPYGAIATEIENHRGSSEEETAIGSNPAAFLIPCHKVIQSSAEFGRYMWGDTRKTAIIGWEASRN